MRIGKNIQSLFVLGLLISFIGTLPFGVLNVLSFNIAREETITNALFFALGVVIVELIYVRLSLLGTSKLGTSKKWNTWIEILIVALLLFLGIQSLAASLHPEELHSTSIHFSIPRFFLGMGLSAINVLQIPFWAAWNLYLTKLGKLERSSYTNYLVGIGCGTFFGLLIFIVIGSGLAQNEHISNQSIQFSCALIYLSTATWMLFQIIRKKLKFITTQHS